MPAAVVGDASDAGAVVVPLGELGDVLPDVPHAVVPRQTSNAPVARPARFIDTLPLIVCASLLDTRVARSAALDRLFGRRPQRTEARACH